MEKKDIRLRRFYEELDESFGDHVWSIENAIEDGELDRFGNPYEQPTKESAFTKIYNDMVGIDDFRFLTSDFIKQEINKYFDDKEYWYTIRVKYNLR